MSAILTHAVTVHDCTFTLSIIRTTRPDSGIAILEWPTETLDGDVHLPGYWFINSDDGPAVLHLDLEDSGDYEGKVAFDDLLDRLMRGIVEQGGELGIDGFEPLGAVN